MNRKKWQGFFCLLFILIYITGCTQTGVQPQQDENTADESTAGTEEKIYGGSITISMGFPETLNPLENKDVRVDKALSLIFDPLFTLDEEMQPKPVLASEYILSADGRTMSVVLKDGLKWQDGEPITAADILFSLQTIKNADPASIYKPAMANVESCYQSSELVAVINYSEPYGGCAYNLCFPVIPKHYYRHGHDFEPMGSGCFRMTEYREKQYMKLEAFESSLKGRPYIQNVKVLIMPSSENDVQAFGTGMTDVLVSGLGDMGKMDISRNINYTSFNSNDFEFIGFNFSQPVLRSSSFRQGLAYGIPLADIVKDIYLGNASKSITPVNPAYALSAPAGVENYAYNPELAHSMLAAAGYDLSKLTLSLLVNSDSSERMRIAGIVADALTELGMTVEIEAVDFNTYLSRLQKGDFQLYIGGTDLDKRIELSPLLETGGSINYGHYSDAHMNELISKCRGALGDENYKRSVRELQTYCAEELPCIGIAFKADVLLTSGRIKGEKLPSAAGIYDNVEQWYIGKQ